MQHRFSRQRETIRRDLMTRKDHPTAEMVFDSIQGADAQVSLATVYRNLAQMAERGDILRFSLRGVDRFDYDTREHGHFCCERCGAVTDVSLPPDHALAGKVELSTGGRVTRQAVFFFGLCAECAALEA